MIVENLPALQQWLTEVLKPLCDADPEALTKYVVALLKKDVSEDELRVSMTEQLDIFLQSGTVPFVTRLFDTIRSREYETAEVGSTEELLAGVEANYIISTTTDEAPNKLAPVSTDSVEKSEADSVGMESKIAETEHLAKKAEADTMEEGQESRDNIEDQSSSDSSDASEDNRSEAKSVSLDVEKRRHWRDKRSRSTSSELSPHGKRKCGLSLSKRIGNSSGRHRWSPIKRRIRRDINKRRKSRSPLRFRGGPQISKTYNRGSISDRSRSRSGSPFRRKRTSSGDGKFRRNPPSPESNSLLDNITNKCSVKSVVVKPAADLRHDTNEANSSCRSRCIDFDEKGVCLRGELCPYDHGSDPVVLKDIANNESVGLSVPPNFTGKIDCDKPMNFLNTIAPVRPPLTSDEYFPESPSIVPPPMMPPFGWGMPRRPMRPRHLGMDPFMGRGGMMRPHMMRQLGPPPFHGQRQLIPVPVEGMQQHHGVQQPMSLLPENPFAVGGARMVCRALFGMRGRGRGAFDHARLGPRLLKPNGNCCLEVRKIPRESNNIESLINHFSRFGNVVSIQLAFDSDPEGALVIFGSHSDALQAYRSTDAVLNNRFIKVYWYNKELAPNNSDGHTIRSTDATMVLSNNKVMEENTQSSLVQVQTSSCHIEQDHLNGTDAMSGNEAKVQEEDEKSLTPTSTSAVLQTESPVTKTPKKTNATTSDVRRKHDMMILLNAQIKEQKSLIQKLEIDRNRMTPKQRDEVLQIIKNLQASCQELKTNIESICTSTTSGSEVSDLSSSNSGKISCSKEEIRRKLLDAELALYMLGKTGHDTIDLEKEILQLRAEEMLLNIRK